MSDHSARAPEKPILFSSAMIRAILSGSKTQTRRILKETVPQPPAMDAIHPAHKAIHPAPYLDSYCGDRKTEANPRGMSNRWCWWTRDDRQRLPTFGVKYVPGDHLWVREAWSPEHKWNGTKPSEIPNGDDIWYWADGNPDYGDWTKPKPSIHMPRWVSRITLEVTAVRVERLQDITEADAEAEGWPGCVVGETPLRDAYPIGWYANLWNDINGAGSWDANPFVVAVTFRRIPNA